MALRERSQVTGHWGHGHEICMVRGKLLKLEILKISLQSVAANASYKARTNGSSMRPQSAPARVLNMVHNMLYSHLLGYSGI